NDIDRFAQPLGIGDRRLARGRLIRQPDLDLALQDVVRNLQAVRPRPSARHPVKDLPDRGRNVARGGYIVAGLSYIRDQTVLVLYLVEVPPTLRPMLPIQLEYDSPHQ